MPSRCHISFSWYDFQRASKSTLWLLFWALGGAGIGFVLSVLPLAHLIEPVSEIVFTVGLETDRPCQAPLSVHAWTDKMKNHVTLDFQSERYLGMFKLVFLQGLGFSMLSTVPFGLALNKQWNRFSRSWWAMLLILSFLFVVGMVQAPLLAHAHLSSYVQVNYLMHIVVMTIVQLLTWDVLIQRLICWAMPDQTCRSWMTAALFAVGSTCLYNGFKSIYWLYFQIESQILKLLLGAVAPHLLSAVCFEIYMLVADRWLIERPEAAIIIMMIPSAWVASTSAMLQLSSTSIEMGIIMELLGFALELKTKRALLAGITPLQIPVDLIFQFIKWLQNRKALKMSTVVPEAMQTVAPEANTARVDEAPTAVDPGVCPTTSKSFTSGSWSATLQSSELRWKIAKRRRTALFENLVCSLNLIELVVHCLMAAVFLTVNMNPAESNAPPIPFSQTVTLFSIKICMELITDLTVMMSAGQGDLPSSASYTLSEKWQDQERSVRATACLIASVVASDITSTSIALFCPCKIPDSFHGTVLNLCPAHAFHQ
eukprot:TRINITY_DN10021_c0_g1_i1.p1 TRINITY_DN10021_c0_g1~~TRINITY_DN10021_c0_g1_i1.p1  ORF type:complete len:541 (-),score=47.94 TRINITY_DN10021_c0_g1_i1:89-1711(-)